MQTLLDTIFEEAELEVDDLAWNPSCRLLASEGDYDDPKKQPLP